MWWIDRMDGRWDPIMTTTGWTPTLWMGLSALLLMVGGYYYTASSSSARNPHEKKTMTSSSPASDSSSRRDAPLEDRLHGVDRSDYSSSRSQSLPPPPPSSSFTLTFEQIHLVQKLKKKNSKMMMPSRDGTLAPSSSAHPRILLHGPSVGGQARPGRLLAIMGPSGAGKSSLLHALAGRIPYQTSLSLSGRRTLTSGQTGQVVEVAPGAPLPYTALVEQQVSFFPHMTVWETVAFRVALHSPSTSLSPSFMEQRVQDLLHQVQLTDPVVQQTLVGDGTNSSATARGISGGERKRLSLAVELIQAPHILLLDEPTTGLDSTAATHLVRTLRHLAVQGHHAIVAVIHQPSQRVFDLCDDVLVLSTGGQQVYFGPRAAVRSYLAQQGRPVPAEMGTAEHLLDCLHPNTQDPSTFPPLRYDPQLQKLQQQQQQQEEAQEVVSSSTHHHQLEGKESPLPLQSTPLDSSNSTPRATESNLRIQIHLLLQRSFREVTRGKTLLLVKAVRQVTLAVVYGALYELGNDQASIQDRFGFLSLVAIGAANMSLMHTLRVFSREKAIVSTELAAGWYRAGPYFLAKVAAEMPLGCVWTAIFAVLVYPWTGLNPAPGRWLQFVTLLMMHGLQAEALGLALGALTPNADVAMALLPAVLVVNLIFDGKNMADSSVPRLLRWIPEWGMIKWGYQGLLLNEFQGLNFTLSSERSRSSQAYTGEEALERVGLSSGGSSARTLSAIFRAQVLVMLVYLGLAYLGLTWHRPRFLIMHPPSSPSPGSLDTQQ